MWQLLLKVKSFTWLSGSMLSYLYKRNENVGPQTNLYMNVHSNFVRVKNLTVLHQGIAKTDSGAGLCSSTEQAFLWHAGRWLDLRNTLGEKNLTSKSKYHMILLPKECGIQLLATQKSINRPGWWKGKFALFQMPATGGQQGSRHLFKGNWQLVAQELL